MTYALPLIRIEQRVQESLAVLEEEGDYPRDIPKDESTRRDNFTDALMLNIASYRSDKGLIEKAFGNYFITTSDDKSVEWLANRNAEEKNETSYARYWHGYAGMLKILLQFLNYQEIRWLLYVCELGLMVLAALLMLRLKKLQYIIPLFLALLFFPLTIVSKSLQFSMVFIPTLIGIISILKISALGKHTYTTLFFTEGIIIAYLDLLTYPLVNVGFLLCFVLILDEDKIWIEKLKNLIVYTVLWGIGYAGMWGTKWLVSSLFLRRNVLADAMDAAPFRMSSGNGSSKWSYWDVLKKNMEICPRLIVVLSILFILYIILKMLRNGVNMQKIKCNIIFLVVAFMPFIWYFALKNHSYIHAFFAHRELAVTCLAILFYLVSIVSDTSRLSKKVS